MRIVFDMQAAQSLGSRVRGIGRYSLALATAVARRARDHEVIFALNHGIPDVVDKLRGQLTQESPRCNVVVWETLGATAARAPGTAQRSRGAEFVRERFLLGLRPDVIHTSSMFEGWTDDVVTSVPDAGDSPLWSATLYDLIPYSRRNTYLTEPGARAWYMEKLGYLLNCRLLLTISEYSMREAVDVLGVDPQRVVNISAACDTFFHQLSPELLQPLEIELRAGFGIAGRFLLYTGGFDVRKNIDGLIRAFAKVTRQVREDACLVIVGQGPEQEIRRLRSLASRHGLGPAEVVFTGYVEDEQLRALYNLCEVHVFPSFHEGFGLPVLEAMACGAPVIAARTTSLPEVVGLSDALFDPEDDVAMALLIERCLSSRDFRMRLRDHGRRQVRRFSWDDTADRAIGAMERLYAGSPRLRHAPSILREEEDTHYRKLIRRLGHGPAYATMRSSLARALALNEPPSHRTLFVDVTMLAVRDAGTGIQRVVKNVVRELVLDPPPAISVELVRFVAGTGYVHARAFAAGSQDAAGAEDRPIDAKGGDVLLGLDLIAHLLPEDGEYFRWMRDRGVALWFVMYDLLPLRRPELFPEGMESAFRRWCEAVADLARGVVCISRAVADDFRDWLAINPPARAQRPAIHSFRLGADLSSSRVAAAVHSEPRASGTFLAVGTIEPRKGYRQLLDAFELLWERGADVRLVVIGRPGWLVDDLVGRMRAIGAREKRLIWLEDADDAQLRHWYERASALIVASEGEGFGLPLIEAAFHGLPLLVRDLAVFREVAGAGATYFSGTSPSALASAIKEWIAAAEAGTAVGSSTVNWISWKESTQQLLAAMSLSSAQPLQVDHNQGMGT